MQQKKENEKRFMRGITAASIFQLVYYIFVNFDYRLLAIFVITQCFLWLAYFRDEGDQPADSDELILVGEKPVKKIRYTLRDDILVIVPCINMAMHIYSLDFGVNRTVYSMFLIVIISVSFLGRVRAVSVMAGIVFILMLAELAHYYGTQSGEYNAAVVGEIVYTIGTVGVMIYYVPRLLKDAMDTKRRVEEMDEMVKDTRAARDRFMANVSHELRTPLNFLVGFINRISVDDPEQHIGEEEDLSYAKHSVKRMEKFTNDVTDYVNIISGAYKPNIREYDFHSMINDCVNTAISENMQKELELVFDISPYIPAYLEGDPDVMRSSINSILQNSIKFTETGYIHLQITCRKESYGINLVVKITDTGIGMSPSTLEALGRKSYFQHDDSTSRNAEGLGLGVVLTKLKLLSVNGVMHVDSVEGRGTTVTLTIPHRVTRDEITHDITPFRGHKLAFFDDERGFANQGVRTVSRQLFENLAEACEIPLKSYESMREMLAGVAARNITHVFMTEESYLSHREEMDEIPDKTTVIILRDWYSKGSIEPGDNARVLHRPLFSDAVINCLRGVGEADIRTSRYQKAFIAPQASILAVDDNNMNIRMLESILAPYEVKVSSALSGKEAVELAGRTRYDMIFMDYMMPEMDGIETFRLIRQLPLYRDGSVPVIALTANAAGGAREMFLEAGFDDYIAKPIYPDILARVLRDRLPACMIKPAPEKPSSPASLIDSPPADMTEPAPEKPSSPASLIDSPPDDMSEPAPEKSTPAGLIDRSVGLSYSCDSEELYMALVQVFVADAPANIEQMEKLFAAGDYKEYTVLTHSLKSNALQVGACALSEEAKAMEKAGKAGDEEFLKKGHEPLIAHFKEVIDEISGWEA